MQQQWLPAVVVGIAAPVAAGAVAMAAPAAAGAAATAAPAVAAVGTAEIDYIPM